MYCVRRLYLMIGKLELNIRVFKSCSFTGRLYFCGGIHDLFGFWDGLMINIVNERGWVKGICRNRAQFNEEVLMGKFKKNVVAFLLTFSLCLVGILQVSQEARAADGVGVVLSRSGSVRAYNVKEINFSLLNPQAAGIVVGVPNLVGITIALYDLGDSYNTGV